MYKLQRIISLIVESPISDQEKLELIKQINKNSINEIELDKWINKVADYFDSLARKYEIRANSDIADKQKITEVRESLKQVAKVK